MKKIVVVDDEPDIVKVVQFRLSKAGYEVFVAMDGQEGWDLIKTVKPDLILLDYFMPKLSGDQVCARVKADPETKNIPVLIMTASSKKVEDEHINKIGANDKILKPFEAEELLKKIKKLVHEVL